MRAATAVPHDWHACYSATYRRYRYTIYNGQTPNLFLMPWSWHRYQRRLDEHAMKSVLQTMLGHHDFSAYQRAGSTRSHARTTLQEVGVDRDGDLLTVEVQATGFLYGMVRLLMGQLVAVGEGRLSPAGCLERWRTRRARRRSPPGALPAARGLSADPLPNKQVVRWPTAVSTGGFGFTDQWMGPDRHPPDQESSPVGRRLQPSNPLIDQIPDTGSGRSGGKVTEVCRSRALVVCEASASISRLGLGRSSTRRHEQDTSTFH